MNKFQKQLSIGAVLATLIVILMSWSTYKTLNFQKENWGRVEKTQEIIIQANKLKNLISSAEAMVRGFVITKNEGYLSNYENYIAGLLPSYYKLSELGYDHPELTNSLDSLSIYIGVKREVLNQQVILKKNNIEKIDPQIEILAIKGKDISDRIWVHIDIIENFYKNNLKQNEIAATNDLQGGKIKLLVGTILLALMNLGLLIFVLITFKNQKEIEQSLKQSREELKRLSISDKTQNQLLEKIEALNQKMAENPDIDELAENIIKTLSSSLNTIGINFLIHNNKGSQLVLKANFGNSKFQKNKIIDDKESIYGSILANNSIHELELQNDFETETAIGLTRSKKIIYYPLILNNEKLGILEIAFASNPSQFEIDFINRSINPITLALKGSLANQKQKLLLEQVQSQSEELEAQAQELNRSNEELRKQSLALQASEEELRAQQEELLQSNNELEKKAVLLEEKNLSIEEAKTALDIKAQELENTNKYKSEFLANMSHELRTPLNSILILAQLLKQNPNHNLNEEEEKYAHVIYNAGNDLLTLINDILDLSKIEAGKLDLNPEKFELEYFLTDLKSLFSETAKTKKINFVLNNNLNSETVLETDRIRLSQIIRNFLSNAFKFTPNNGTVTLEISRKNSMINFSVIDSGIGINKDKLDLIFEAFKQADGSTSRKYGGTGLGLSISKELAQLLGAKISVESEVNKGSKFTLSLPNQLNHNQTKEFEKEIVEKPIIPNLVTKVFIIEDDILFSELLKKKIESNNIQVKCFHNGNDFVASLESEIPDAIVLDINLPDISGWEVLKTIRNNPRTESIKIHIISGNTIEPNNNEIDSFHRKPFDLKIFDDLFKSKENSIQIGFYDNDHDNFKSIQDFFNKNSLELVNLKSIDENELLNLSGLIFNPNLLKDDELNTLNKIKSNKENNFPIIVISETEPDALNYNKILKIADSMILKTPSSHKRLLDELDLFLNNINNKNKESLDLTIDYQNFDVELSGKKILLVDDDMRNVFAISTLLQNEKILVEVASNGLEALEILSRYTPDLILMDIMMPEMDGNTATRKIREIEKFKRTPIIAISAKAMKEDKENILNSGANDFIAKPIDTKQLISLIRIWIQK